MYYSDSRRGNLRETSLTIGHKNYGLCKLLQKLRKPELSTTLDLSNMTVVFPI